MSYIKHGHWSNGKPSRAYKAWERMMSRCFYRGDASYENYGGRGITVIFSWHNFEMFYADMGDPPPDMSLDRKDNNKNYSKDNCRWATNTEQGNNRRDNHIIVFEGQEWTRTELAKAHDMSPQLLYQRLKQGWSLQDAVAKPIQKYVKKLSK